MNKPYLIIVILILLVVLCTAFVFSNSLKNAEESAEDSSILVQVVEKIAQAIAPDNQVDWNHIVRKLAHLTEFLVLGVFTTLLLLSFKQKIRFAAVCAPLCVFVIACADELIQHFSPGRNPCFTDVMIDTAGAWTGIGLVLLFYLVLTRRLKALNNS